MNIQLKIRNDEIMKNKFLLINLLLMTACMVASENQSFDNRTVREISKGFQYSEHAYYFLAKKTIEYDKDILHRIAQKNPAKPHQVQRLFEISSQNINHRVIKTRPSALAYTLLIGTVLTGAYLHDKIKNNPAINLAN